MAPFPRVWFTALVLTLSAGAHAHTACLTALDTLAPVAVTVVVSPVGEAPVAEAPLLELTKRAKPHAKVRDRVLGATTATRASSFLYRYREVTLDDGSLCVQPRVEITLAYRPLVVEVATELSDHLCLRAAILAHEQQHVRAYRDHLDVAAASLTRSLPVLLGASVYPARTFDIAAARIDTALDARIERAIHAAVGNVAALHEAIDTAEESERMYHVCHGALHALWKGGLVARAP